MANLAYWDDGSGAWDTLKLGDIVMPGIWRVECDCERNMDKKKPKGADCARLADHGYEPAELTLHGEIIGVEQWKALQAAVPKLHPRQKGGPRSPVRAEHPALALMGVHTIYIRAFRAPQIKGGKLDFSIRALEWVAEPKKKKEKPAAVTSANVEGTGWNFQSTPSDGIPYMGWVTPSEQAIKDAEFERLTGPPVHQQLPGWTGAPL
jgi:hypothetical protein